MLFALPSVGGNDLFFSGSLALWNDCTFFLVVSEQKESAQGASVSCFLVPLFHTRGSQPLLLSDSSLITAHFKPQIDSGLTETIYFAPT